MLNRRSLFGRLFGTAAAVTLAKVTPQAVAKSVESKGLQDKDRPHTHVYNEMMEEAHTHSSAHTHNIDFWPTTIASHTHAPMLPPVTSFKEIP